MNKEEIAYELKDKNGNVIKTFKKSKGCKAPRGVCKLSKELIIEMEAAGVLRKDVAKHFGVSEATIRKVAGKKI